MLMVQDQAMTITVCDYLGDNCADINPEDIESITVLKGAGATALYGSRAANGALIITTKSGIRKDKGIGVTLNSNTSINTVLRWPDYQYEYGQGTDKALNSARTKNIILMVLLQDGASTSGTSSAFGPRFNGQQYFQYDPAKQGQAAERTLWQPYKNGIKDYWHLPIFQVMIYRNLYVRFKPLLPYFWKMKLIIFLKAENTIFKECN